MNDPNTFRTLLERVKAETEVFKIELPIKKDRVGVFSVEAMDLHYGTLYGNYVKKALAGGGDFQIAGAKLHSLFFEQFQEPKIPNTPTGPVGELITDHYGGYTDFKKIFTETALDMEGSGWVYLNKSGKIQTIPNHKLIDNIVLIVDMWEHSYVIDFLADKKAYINAMWKIIDWEVVNGRLK